MSSRYDELLTNLNVQEITNQNARLFTWCVDPTKRMEASRWHIALAQNEKILAEAEVDEADLKTIWYGFQLWSTPEAFQDFVIKVNDMCGHQWADIAMEATL